MSPKKRKAGGAWYAKVLDGSPAIETAALAFELQPMGGGESVTTLTPHTAYELHYTAQAEAVSCYFLYAASASAGSSLDLIQPAVTGPWSDDRLFDFEDAVDGPGELSPAPNHPDLQRTDWSIDLHYFGAKEKGDAPPSAHACTITTGESGELTLDFHMFGRPREEGQPVVVMEASATFTVQRP